MVPSGNWGILPPRPASLANYHRANRFPPAHLSLRTGPCSVHPKIATSARGCTMTDRVLHMRHAICSYTSTPMLYSLQNEVYYHDRYPDGLVPRLALYVLPPLTDVGSITIVPVGFPIDRRRRDIATVPFPWSNHLPKRCLLLPSRSQPWDPCVRPVPTNMTTRSRVSPDRQSPWLPLAFQWIPALTPSAHPSAWKSQIDQLVQAHVARDIAAPSVVGQKELRGGT